MSFTQFSKVIKFEEINDNEILIIDEYHETYDSKKTNNYRVYENSIRFPFKFKIGLTSTPFITNNSLLKIIQYLCSKSFYNTSIAYHPELQNEFIKFFKRNLIVNNTNEINRHANRCNIRYAG
jgi:superfamily II DNA or RNA helicase